MKFQVIVIVSFLGFLSLLFQNCSKSNFQPVSADSYFKAESVVDPADNQGADVVAIQPVASSTASDTNTRNTNVVNINGNSNINSHGGDCESGTTINGNSVQVVSINNGNKKNTKSKTDSDDDMVTTTDVVECELLGQNNKIVLASDLTVDSSNSESSRVCMSGYACAKLINAYAAEHNCSMDRGPASSPGSQTVCAKKFPGSQGVCANARMISDSDVEKILEAMGK